MAATATNVATPRANGRSFARDFATDFTVKFLSFPGSRAWHACRCTLRFINQSSHRNPVVPLLYKIYLFFLFFTFQSPVERFCVSRPLCSYQRYHVRNKVEPSQPWGHLSRHSTRFYVLLCNLHLCTNPSHTGAVTARFKFSTTPARMCPLFSSETKSDHERARVQC